jgi:hypothetical protein
MNRRTHRQLALITLLISLFASLGCDAMVSRLVDRAAERQMNSTDLGLLEDDALNVFLCGTGSPLPDPTSAGACTIVVAGGKVYVVDVGPGVTSLKKGDHNQCIMASIVALFTGFIEELQSFVFVSPNPQQEGQPFDAPWQGGFGKLVGSNLMSKPFDVDFIITR